MKKKDVKKWNKYYKNIKKDSFYSSLAWKVCRAWAIETMGQTCAMCGRSPKTHGVAIHVDHIKPRSKFPELAFDKNNLQILCDDCNIGKLNRFSTDYRMKEQYIHDLNMLENMPVTMQ